MFGRRPVMPALAAYGVYAYLIPIAPWLGLAFARRAPARAPALLLAAWATPLALLTLDQERYGNEFTPAAAICFALGLALAADALTGRPRLPRRFANALAVCAGAALLAPSVVPRLRASYSLAAPRHAERSGDLLVATPTGTLVRFAYQVRDATPETPGWLADDGAPEWGILSNPNFGHTLRYYSRRPVAADGFWDKFPSFYRAASVLGLEREEDALAAARDLRGRYVVTAAGPPEVQTIGGRLQAEDGTASEGRPALGHFRLVTEGPAGGRPLSDLFRIRRPAHVIPYKLFEIVPGAGLEVRASRGTRLEAEVDVETPLGRRFTWRAEGEADESGVARLRLPYATRTRLPARPTGPWRVRAGDVDWTVDLDDDQVERGATIAREE
jgi:hypothetical protein